MNPKCVCFSPAVGLALEVEVEGDGGGGAEAGGKGAGSRGFVGCVDALHELAKVRASGRAERSIASVNGGREREGARISRLGTPRKEVQSGRNPHTALQRYIDELRQSENKDVAN